MYQDSFFSSARMGFMMLPVVLRRVIAANVGIYLIMAIFSLFGLKAVNGWIVQWFALAPDAMTNVYQPWRLVSYMFLHGGGFHIIFNMLWLWWMGRPVENSLGSRNFAVLFLGSGIGGGLVHIAFAMLSGGAPTIGASGAVFGIMVVFAYLFPRQPIMLLFLPPLEARYVVAGLIVLDVLFHKTSDGIARIVHLGGALWGYLLISAYYRGYNYDAWISAVTRRYAGVFRTSGSGKGVRSAGSGSGRSTSGGQRSSGGAGWGSGTSPRNKNMRAVSDAEILEEFEGDRAQTEMDRILDKISRDGSGSLTAEEKRILFELSNRK